jgi:hypothetical protein
MFRRLLGWLLFKPAPPYDPEESTSFAEDMGWPRWPGLMLAAMFALMIVAAGWDRLCAVCRIPRKATSPSLVKTEW